MSDQPSPADEPTLYDLLDDEGKAWCDRVIDWFNAGGYAEAAKAFAADEAAIEGDLAS